MTDFGKPHRAALIAGKSAPVLSLEAKRFAAINYLGRHHVLAGGRPDWTRPTVLPAWLANRSGAIQRTAGL